MPITRGRCTTSKASAIAGAEKVKGMERAASGHPPPAESAAIRCRNLTPRPAGGEKPEAAWPRALSGRTFGSDDMHGTMEPLRKGEKWQTL